jgi:hypothetical protein
MTQSAFLMTVAVMAGLSGGAGKVEATMIYAKPDCGRKPGG